MAAHAPLDPVMAAWLAESRARCGLPPKVTDMATIAKLVALVRSDLLYEQSTCDHDGKMR